MGKIAAELERALARRDVSGAPGGVAAQTLAGDGSRWQVSDVLCTSGPADQSFEEQHTQVCIALVVAGSFGYRRSGSAQGGDLMTPGSIMLGEAGQTFECGHDHGRGDRCVAFHYAPEYFERLTGEAGGAEPLSNGAGRAGPMVVAAAGQGLRGAGRFSDP